ncbi:P-loop ATPase, Sll1717 family [Bacillus thuringiensis]|uniref:P-loop ATPase, Sll1717 family n=1 Tax=Bacillus thuringiensis TaxID=1428 RepID=UPI001596FC26|nr:FunZ [Bacillus thuringiensis]
MVKKVPLKKLFIGNIDGEDEAAREDFNQLFYTKNRKFDEIMRPEKFIIAGRKGSGKTILAKYVHNKVNENKGSYCEISTKNDYTLRKLIDLPNRELKREEISHFCKWTFLIKFCDVILDDAKWKKKMPGTAEFKLYKFRKKIHTDNIFKIKDFSESFGSKSALKADLKTKLPKELGIAATREDNAQVSTNYIPKEYFELLGQLEKLLFKCIKNKKDKEIVLIYDDLDELEEKIGGDSFYHRALIAMIETVKNLNLVFRDLGKKNTKIILLLRSDIIDEIHKFSANSNKFVTESKVNLYWIDKNYEGADHPLMEMILNKIQKSVKEYESLSKDELYQLVFSNQINEKDIISYLLDYSFGRPRDITWYLNLIIQKTPEAIAFNPKAVKSCAQDYSKWFYAELENEISINENKSMLLDGLQLINDLKKVSFNYSMIEKYFNEKSEFYPNIKNLKETMRHLYKIGVIGNSWRHKKDGNTHIYRYAWGYRDDAISNPNFSQYFVVHYGLRKYFSI